MRTSWKNFVPALLAVVVCTGALCAQSSPWKSPPQGQAGEQLPPPLRVVQQALQLDEAQTAEWVRLRQDTDPAVRQLAEELRQVERTLDEELQSENPSAGTVGQLVVRVHELRSAIVEIRRSAVEAFAEVLDEEQLSRLHSIQQAARLQGVLPAFREAGLIF